MSRALNELDPDLREMAYALQSAALGRRVGIIFTQTYRTFAEQDALYAQGRTTPGHIVTHAKAGYSWHNWRRAFDVAIRQCEGDTTPNDLYDGPWQIVGELGEALGLSWGGRWKFPDLPHFEHTRGLTLAGMLEKFPTGKGEAIVTGAA